MSQQADFSTVLVTRPAHQAAGQMTALALRGYTPVAAPVLEMHVTDRAVPAGDFDALVFTSANGVAAYAEKSARRDLDVFAVGPSTAMAARKAGFQRIITGEEGAVSLAQIISARLQPGAQVLHPAGRDVAVDLAPLLAPHGIGVTGLALYTMERLAALPDAARTAIGRGCVVMLHSVRSAAAFGALAGNVSSVTAICQSSAIAEAANDFGFRALAVAGQPNEAAMLDCLEAVKGRA